MQQLARSARILSSPTVLIVIVWSVLLIVVAIGPIDYSNQPSFLSDTQGLLLKQQSTATVGLLWWWGRKEGTW